jgi:hypothetical protein
MFARLGFFLVLACVLVVSLFALMWALGQPAQAEDALILEDGKMISIPAGDGSFLEIDAESSVAISVWYRPRPGESGFGSVGHVFKDDTRYAAQTISSPSGTFEVTLTRTSFFAGSWYVTYTWDGVVPSQVCSAIAINFYDDDSVIDDIDARIWVDPEEKTLIYSNDERPVPAGGKKLAEKPWPSVGQYVVFPEYSHMRFYNCGLYFAQNVVP